VTVRREIIGPCEPASFLDGRVLLHAGDCLDVLASLPEASVDSVVTDPPYGLQFMGREWDKLWRNKTEADQAYVEATAGTLTSRQRKLPDYSATNPQQMQAWHEAWAREALRVLKPGGFLLAMGGTRTYHRLACAIEDAGFEVRNMVAWLYGSGFPKSLDVSKAIDKAAGAEREVVGEGPFSGRKPKPYSGGSALNISVDDPRCGHPITAPATDAAKQWEGWGTDLKPALEPICVARKPLSEKTVAANVLKHGTGAINIAATRVKGAAEPWAKEQFLCVSCAELADQSVKRETLETRVYSATKNVEPTMRERARQNHADTNRMDIGCSNGMKAGDTNISLSTGKYGKTQMDLSPTIAISTTSTRIAATTDLKTCDSCGKPITDDITIKNIIAAKSVLPPRLTAQERGDGGAARWPANVVHDGSSEVLELFPEQPPSKVGSGGAFNSGRHGGEADLGSNRTDFIPPIRGHADSGGSAARYFYCAKADQDSRLGSRHPTIKPLDLMQWLVRLVTPRGGTCLDCFAGTGTTGEAAWREGMRAILIEREPEYCADIARRMELAVMPTKRAAVAKTKNKLDKPEDLPLFAPKPEQEDLPL